MRAESKSPATSAHPMPLADALLEALPEALREQAALINERFLSLEEQRQALLETRKRTSRKIGECKRAGEDSDGLIETMQTLSQQLRDHDTAASELQATLDALLVGSIDSDGTQSGQASLPTRFEAIVRYPGEQPAAAIEELGPADEASWDDYVRGNPRGSVYHLSAFRRVIESTMGQTCIYLLARDSAGQVVGVLPCAELKSPLFGHNLVSLPYFNYGGPLGESALIEQQLLEAMAERAAQRGAPGVEYREVAVRESMPRKDNKVSMLLSLPDDAETLWQAIGSKVRAQVKRCHPHEPVFRVGGSELLDDFYRVFARNMRDLGTPVYSRELFASILAQPGLQAEIVVVYIGGRAAAAGFLLQHQGVMEIPWASALRSANHTNVNMFMYWQILGHAIASDCHSFDFGRSSKDAGTYRFKKQWGAQPVALHWHYWLAEGEELPQVNPDNPKYRLLIWGWQKLPVWLSKLIGPGLVKHIP